MLPRLSLLTLSLLSAHSAISAPFFLGADQPYPSRLTGQFLTGGERQLAGFGDGMLPFMQTKDRIFFLDGAVMGGRSSQMTYSGGLGYRGIQDTRNARGILGVYTFAEYFDTAAHNGLWQINPGLEWLNERYEARLQGYIPINNRAQTYSNTWASLVPQSVIDDSGHTTSTLNRVTGHQLLDTPVALVERFGPGVEFEAGRFFPYGKGLWLRAGGYHFNYQQVKSINGVEANVEMAMTRHAYLLIQDNYDNQNKNRFSVGIRVNFGGSESPIGTLEERMTSPIIRHIARQSYGAAQPTRQDFSATGPTVVTQDNVWFFSPSGTNPIGSGFMAGAVDLSSCTAENPCLTITSGLAADINAVSPNANLFFASGSYTPSHTSGTSQFANLADGQSVWGRTTGWLQAANGNARPVVNGGLFWGGGGVGNGALYDMRVVNNDQLIPASLSGLLLESVIAVGAGGSIAVNNSLVTVSSADLGVTHFDALGILAVIGDAVVNNSLVSVTNVGVNSVSSNGLVVEVGNAIVSNSSFNVTSSGTNGVFATGMFVSTGNLTLTNSTITTNAANSGIDNSVAMGILVSNGIATLNNNTVSSNATSSGTDDVTAYSLLVGNGSAAVNNSTLSASAISSGTDDVTAYGLLVAVGTASVNDSTINSTVAGSGIKDFDVFGLLVGNGDATISNSVINTSANRSGDGYIKNNGVFVGSGTVEVRDSSITSTATTSGDGVVEVYGVQGLGDAIVGGSTITSNATSSGTGDTAALAVLTGEDATVNGSTLNASATGLNGNTVAAYGVLVAGNATLSDSTVTSSGSTTGSGIALVFGVQASNGDATIINSTIDSNASALSGTALAFGVQADTISFTGLSSFITALTTPSGGADAVDGVVTNSNGSQCTENGVTGPCV